MSSYRRLFIPGGTWFFTVNLLQRQNNNLLIREIDLLRSIVESVRKRHPFRINAWVVLPEHMHAVWSLPPNDTDFSTRWRLIKSGFSRALPKPNTGRQCVLPPPNAEFGNGIFGNMP